MNRGKHTCKILKEIRRQIAEANDIEFITSECHFQGECKGTCPKCEAEVRYLEQQLEKRRLIGKAATVIGVSMTILTESVGLSSCQTKSSPLQKADLAKKKTSIDKKQPDKVTAQNVQSTIKVSKIIKKLFNNKKTFKKQKPQEEPLMGYLDFEEVQDDSKR